MYEHQVDERKVEEIEPETAFVEEREPKKEKKKANTPLSQKRHVEGQQGSCEQTPMIPRGGGEVGWGQRESVGGSAGILPAVTERNLASLEGGLGCSSSNNNKKRT